MLHLVPIFRGAMSDLLTPLGERLGDLLEMPVAQASPGFDPEEAFDAVRSQYNSRLLLGRLRQHAPFVANRVLGVAGVDLFIPVLTYVFGEAELLGRAAVVSTFRLDSELYGLPKDPTLMFARLVKESVHEIGHTFGLVHCGRDDCVMHSSTYVEGIDLKNERFCDRCLKLLRRQQAPGR